MSKQKSDPLAHIFTKSSPIFWFALVLALLFLAFLSNYLPIREVLSIAGSVVSRSVVMDLSPPGSQPRLNIPARKGSLTYFLTLWCES